jgi:hypothetical protein
MRFYVIDESGKRVLRTAPSTDKPGFKAVPVGTFQGAPVYRYEATSTADVLRANGAGKPGPRDTASILARNGAKPFTPPAQGQNQLPNLFEKTEPNFFKPGGEHKVPLRSDTAMPDMEAPRMGAASAPSGKQLAQQNAPLQNRLKKKMAQKKPMPPVAPPEAKASGLGAFDMSGMGNTFDEMKGVKPEDKIPETPTMQIETQAPVQPVDPLGKFKKTDYGAQEDPSLVQSAQSKTVEVTDPLARVRGEAPPPALDGAKDPTGRGIPWESRYSKTSSLQEPIVDKEKLAEAEAAGKTGEEETQRRYQEYLAEIGNIGKNTPEQDALKQEKRDALSRYTQGLDRGERSKFIDAIANNLGKIAGGVAGFATGTPVGKYYEYAPSGIGDMQAQNAEKKFAAESGDISSREKDIKEQQALKLAGREKTINMAMSLNKDGQDRLFRILDLTKKIQTSGGTEGVDFISPEKIGFELDKLDNAERIKKMDLQAEALEKNLARLNQNDQNRLGRESAERIADKKLAAGPEGGTTTSEEDTGLRKGFEAARSYGAAYQGKLTGNSIYAEAKKRGDLAKAKEAVLREVGVLRSGAPKDMKGTNAAFAAHLQTALPHINSFEELENISATLDTMARTPGSALWPVYHKEKRVEKGPRGDVPMQNRQDAAPAAPAPAPTSAPTQTPQDVIAKLEAALATEKHPYVKAQIREKIADLKKKIGGK